MTQFSFAGDVLTIKFDNSELRNNEKIMFTHHNDSLKRFYIDTFNSSTKHLRACKANMLLYLLTINATWHS